MSAEKSDRYVTLDLFTGEVVDAGDEETKPAPPRRGNPWLAALAEVCGRLPEKLDDGRLDWNSLTDADIGQLRRYAADIRRAGGTPEQIAAFGVWYARNDWRGKRGEKPAPAYVSQLWNKFIRAHNAPDVGRQWQQFLTERK